MDIQKHIKSLDKKGLIALKKYVEDYLAAYEDSNLGGMTLLAFEQKLRDERLASNRLINIIRRLRWEYKHVNEITDYIFWSQQGAGAKTLSEFKELRGF